MTNCCASCCKKFGVKISWTIILGILFVMPLWVSFDVYLTAEPLTSSNF